MRLGGDNSASHRLRLPLLLSRNTVVIGCHSLDSVVADCSADSYRIGRSYLHLGRNIAAAGSVNRSSIAAIATVDGH